MTDGDRRLRVGGLARIEGEAGLRVVLDGDTVRDVELDIYEPPRFFEAFLRGRRYDEVPDLTSRICGICPVAYQSSGWRAVEDACGVDVGPEIAALRRLLYCGEWISSHTLHVYLLHAPDFLGLPDVVALARADRAAVERGLGLKKAGNAILETVGGRAIHPVNTRVGGFHRAPPPAELAALAGQLRPALDAALATVNWVAGFDVPDVELDHRLLAVHDPERYAIEGTQIGTTAPGTGSGPVFDAAEFPDHVTETQVPYSTALHARLDGERYLTGPLARYTLNSARLSPLAREAAASAGLGESCRNPFRSIAVRAVEVVYAVEEALRLIDEYVPPRQPAIEVPPCAGTGHGISEAPRGLLYHRYELDAAGLVRSADIVPPTAQNQAVIEDDLRRAVAGHLDLDPGADDAALTGLCERTIRNHDPCISCSAHFLDLRVERR